MLGKTASVVIVLLLVFFSLAAQSQQTKSGEEQANATNTAPCAFDFASGANNTYFRFCVTATGNIPAPISSAPTTTSTPRSSTSAGISPPSCCCGRG